jgi:selenocysteine lyase/cysteine desulfurase
MPTGLYLDYARLGLMPPRASRAHQDFARLVGREGASAAVMDLLRGGFDNWPRGLRCRYPDLGDWRGIGPFLQALRVLSGAPEPAEVLVSSHSAPLVRLAAHLLCRTCRVILHTDLEWPPYLNILRAEAGRQGRRMVEVPVRQLLLADRANRADLIDQLGQDARRYGADGLFLTEITSDGIRMPLAPLAASLSNSGAPRFVVVDAAQVLGHVPLDVRSGPGDLYLGGCHKWVGSGFPLSVAVAPRRRTRELVRDAAESLLDEDRIDDPLLRFTRWLSADHLGPGGDTVNLGPLFPAAAAVCAELGHADSAALRFTRRLEHRRALSQVAHEAGWEAITPHPDHQSGILLVRTARRETRDATPDLLQSSFRNRGVTLTGYPGGIIRASLPGFCCAGDWTDEARAAFRLVRLDLEGKGGRAVAPRSRTNGLDGGEGRFAARMRPLTQPGAGS